MQYGTLRKSSPTWRRCERCPDHALIDVHDADSGDKFTVRIPYEHRHTGLGWGDRPRVRFRNRFGRDCAGIEAARGTKGATIMDHRGTFHEVDHGDFDEPEESVEGDAAEQSETPLEQARKAMLRAVRFLMRRGTDTASISAAVPEDLEGEAEAMPRSGSYAGGKIDQSGRNQIRMEKGKELKAGQRWITVHPNGKDEKGVPVLIQKEPDGTHRIVGGAGGKLSHVILHNVGSEEEHKEKAKEKAKERRAAEKERRAGMTEEERETEDSTVQELKDKKMLAEREFIGRVRETLGGVKDDLDESKLAGLSPGARNTIITRHHKKQLTQAMKAKDAAARKLVEAHADEARQRAAIQRELHDEDPAQVHEAVQAAMEDAALRDQERKELAAERRERKQRRPPGKSEVGRKAAEQAAEVLDQELGADNGAELANQLGQLGGRNDSDDFVDPKDIPGTKASEELLRRALQAKQDALTLRSITTGEDPPEGVTPEQRLEVHARALKRAGIDPEEGDDEAQKAAAANEAARLLRRAEITELRADKAAAKEMEQEDDGAGWGSVRMGDAMAAMAAEVGSARELGLTEAAQTPLQDAEAAAILEVLQDADALRTASSQYRKAKKAAES
jgi:hypothetical protein